MRSRWIASIGVALVALTLALGPTLAQTAAFVEPFSGTPPQPQPYQNPHNWDLFFQGFNSHYAGAAAQVAHHGPNCEPPGFPYTASNTHPLTREQDGIFICNNHLMTSTGLAGYAAIYMTPPAVADFSSGDAVISWEMSTLRTGARDWVDVVITPWAEHSQMAYNNNDQHIPPHTIHLTLAGTNVWQVFQRIDGGTAYNQGRDTLLPGDGSTTWDDVFRDAGLTESPQRRDRFEVHLSRTHISLCMPGYQHTGGVFCWVNTTLAQPLDPSVWHDQAAVQFNHRSYNVEKSCSADEDQFSIVHSDYGDAHCPPNTWHWSNITIQPYAPYSIIPSATRLASSGRVDFLAPAPSNAFLSFVQFGETSQLRVSFDGGQTWQAPRLQPAVAPSTENGEAIFTPMPQGAQSVMVRGANGFWGTFEATDFAIYGAPSGQVTVQDGQPTSTPTPASTASPTPTSSPDATPSATPTPDATVTLTATATATAEPTLQAAATQESTSTPSATSDVPQCRVSVEINGTPGPYRPC